MSPRDRRIALRRRCYEILEQGPVGDRTSMLVDRLLILLILVNLVAVALESVAELAARYRILFYAVELFSLVVFSLEYALRVWSTVEHRGRHQSAARAAWR